MVEEDSLKKYMEKRNFDLTPEPFTNSKASLDKPKYVIQKHKASRLHYDFRIEVDGVLKSWAIPKGPSNDISQKRLAIPTEDHPIDYMDFEGIIPLGNYGAGMVIVWDNGTYYNLNIKHGKEITIPESIEKGHVEIFLEGEKLYGAYALIRTGREGKKFWLFLKMKDEYADKNDILQERPESVLTGRMIKDMENKD